MARFGFCDGFYTSSAVSADAQTCLNLYPEINESQQGKSSMNLLNTPGLVLFGTVADKPHRGATQINGRYFVAAGASLFEVSSSGSTLHTYSIGNDGNPVSLSASATQLMIASAGQGYCLNLASNTITGPIANIAGVVQVGYSDGFFVALIGNSAEIFVSNVLDGTTWPGGQAAIVSVFAGNVVSMVVDHREVCLLGNNQSQCYYDSGNTFPYDVIQGGFMEQGSAATFGVSKLDNTYLWWAQDERGGRMAFRAQGYSPVRISTHAIENELRGYSTISDAVSWSYQSNGHTFWVTTFPTADKTWVYDVATQKWHQRSFFLNGVHHAHLAITHAYVFGKHLVGDRNSGKIYQMDENFYDDAGNTKVWVRRSPYVAAESQWMYFQSLELEADMGLNSIAGGGTPTSFSLRDSSGVVWNVYVSDDGTQLTASSIGTGTANSFILSDPGLITSWQFTISTDGSTISTVPVTFSTSYPTTQAMVSINGLQNYLIQVTSGGLIQIVGAGQIFRGPQIMLRWSNDGARTWVNADGTRSLGKLGEYANRTRWLRLGRCWGTHGRVFELSGSDPVPIRITDAYLQASPDMPPTPRLLHNLRKGA